MSIKDLFSLAALKDTVSVGGIALIIIASLLQVSKININPWDAFFSWIGDKLNAKMNRRMDAMEKEISGIKQTLSDHIAESEARDLQDMRRDILEFANSCMNGRKHTKEQFEFVINECDDYESYIESKKIKNGVITSAIKEIRRLYDKCVQEKSFLRENEPDGREA